ncbi:hypothetical protein ABZ759_32235 [Streptomyces sp. NPDC047860]|uniref:hypothetical protein n=1 Tax=Streptomyces sp. NPDC047860 TaxID=3155743 RepID=UPI0033F59E52
MRNTKAFKEAVAETLAELASRGVTLAPSTVEDTIEKNISAVSGWASRCAPPGGTSTPPHSPTASPTTHAPSRRAARRRAPGTRRCRRSATPSWRWCSLAFRTPWHRTGGDLYGVIVNVAVNAWMAGHIHGEDGCTGCDGSRGPAGHDWEARMRTIIEMQPDIAKWFDRDV